MDLAQGKRQVNMVCMHNSYSDLDNLPIPHYFSFYCKQKSMSIEKTHQKPFNLEYRAKIMYLKVTHFTFYIL